VDSVQVAQVDWDDVAAFTATCQPIFVEMGVHAPQTFGTFRM
jgi:hypothetical protein